MMTLDRYQSSPDAPGTMPTGDWFAALLRGIDGPLGTVLDVGSAEGVMSLLAVEHGAEQVLGIGLTDDRMAIAREAAKGVPYVAFREMPAAEMHDTFRTIVYSMMAHWLGATETARFARLAQRNFAIVFRLANDHYAIPENGTWFPTLAELDEVVGGVRTHEELVLVQDHGKEVWAATYRTDLRVEGDWVWKGDRRMPLATGRDLHGDPPFRPTIGAPLAVLTQDERAKVRRLLRDVARDAGTSGFYPTDVSPRNIIVGPVGAVLVDRDEIESYTGRVSADYLPIWRTTLSTIGIANFDGDLRSLL